ncbi:hypothetical protein [Akkermansia glycaniphila]|uniref:Uncharacterized protein n=1 Tax=Akkermansia glycaniphila TaxID=1679444 RepID=A0A1C7PAX6_9BACT|nr:hypothetical protein [Akkermansia glycaniphila]OCA02726.1 hypothetical protein AC781_08795 [Akkermansia glycaniphila]SEH97540.1 Hypothetical protein PYTT_2223 [Akkermansia glycaniphila]
MSLDLKEHWKYIPPPDLLQPEPLPENPPISPEPLPADTFPSPTPIPPGDSPQPSNIVPRTSSLVPPPGPSPHLEELQAAILSHHNDPELTSILARNKELAAYTRRYDGSVPAKAVLGERIARELLGPDRARDPGLYFLATQTRLPEAQTRTQAYAAIYDHYAGKLETDYADTLARRAAENEETFSLSPSQALASIGALLLTLSADANISSTIKNTLSTLLKKEQSPSEKKNSKPVSEKQTE